MSIQATGSKILVRIDKAAQKKKTVRASGLIIPPSFEYMMYNLQYGLIISVGEEVDDPDIRVGRTAILHHTVEENDQYLLERQANGDEDRIVRVRSDLSSSQFFGVFDEDGNILPHGNTPLPGEKEPESFVFGFPEVQETVDSEVIKDEVSGTTTAWRGRKLESGLYAPVMVATDQEAEEKKHRISEVHAVSKKEKFLRPGDRVVTAGFNCYPINLFNTEYWVLRREHIYAVQKEEQQ